MPLTGAHPCWLYTDTHIRTHTSYPSPIRRRERAQVVAQDESSATIWQDFFFSLPPPLYLSFTHTHALPHISFDLDPLRGYTRRGKKKKNEAGLSLPALTPPPAPTPKEGNLKITVDTHQLRCLSKIKITHPSQGPKFFFYFNLYERDPPPPLALPSLLPSLPPLSTSLHSPPLVVWEARWMRLQKEPVYLRA